jgi:hypothetical protein
MDRSNTRPSSVGDILSGLLPDTSLVFWLVRNEKLVGLRLCGTVGVRVVQQVLDPNQDLFKSNCGTPTLLFVQNGQADRSRRIDIRMKEGRGELALGSINK